MVRLRWIAALCLALVAFSNARGQYGPSRPPAGQSQPPARGQAQPQPRQPVYRQQQDPRSNPAGVRVAQNPNQAAASLPTSAPGPAGQMIARPFDALNPEQQQYLDRLLTAWEQHSSKIERYRCDFERWEYDPVFGPADPKLAKTYATGKLRYAAPDKGMFKVDTIKVYTPPAKPGDKPQWLEKKENIGEHWVCDGKRIFEFDTRAKRLIERELPPEMHGKAIVDGPLPFLFGAEKAKIEARYWLRVITPEDTQGEYWLEAAPKFRKDAQNFKMVHVIIDEKDFLPKAIQVFDPSFDEMKRPIRTVFTFNKREFNWNTTLDSLNIFHREFYEPATPLGWKKITESFVGNPAELDRPANPPAEAKKNPFKLPFKFK